MRLSGIAMVCGLSSIFTTASADTWLLQLHNPNARAVLHSGFRTAALDYSRDGSDAERLPAPQVRALRRAGIEALAYLPLADASNDRFYWNPAWVEEKDSNQFTGAAPGWLGHTYPELPGSYKVRYWDSDWRDHVLRPYLDRILRQGFTGVYLEMDAFDYWANPSSYGPNGETFRAGDPEGDEADASRRMIRLVEWIAQYGRAKTGGNFSVFQQNEVALFRYDRGGGRYLRSLTGFGVEDLFYNETGKQPLSETRFRLRFLRELRAKGKRVLVVDYLDNGDRSDGANLSRIAKFVARCDAEGFDYYAARAGRSLSFINRIPGVQP